MSINKFKISYALKVTTAVFAAVMAVNPGQSVADTQTPTFTDVLNSAAFLRSIESSDTASRINAAADLLLTNLHTSTPSVAANQFITLNTLFQNQGGTMVPWTLNLFYLSSDPSFTNDVTLIGCNYPLQTAAGEMRPLTNTYWIPNIAPGTYYIRAVTNLGMWVAESDQSNNYSNVISIYVGHAPQ